MSNSIGNDVRINRKEKWIGPKVKATRKMSEESKRQ